MLTMPFDSFDIRTLLGRLESLRWTSIFITLPLTLDDQRFSAILGQPSALVGYCLRNVSSLTLPRLDYRTNIYQDIFISWNGSVLKHLPAWFSTNSPWLRRSVTMRYPLALWDPQNVRLYIIFSLAYS